MLGRLSFTKVKSMFLNMTPKFIIYIMKNDIPTISLYRLHILTIIKICEEYIRQTISFNGHPENNFIK